MRTSIAIQQRTVTLNVVLELRVLPLVEYGGFCRAQRVRKGHAKRQDLFSKLFKCCTESAIQERSNPVADIYELRITLYITPRAKFSILVGQ